MGVSNYVTDKATGYVAEVDTSDGEMQGLVVATRPLKTYTPINKFFTNPTYGPEMNQDGAFGGAPLLIHNGVDDVAWTMSEPVGVRWVADSAVRFHSGAQSMLAANPNVGDVMQVINNLGPGDDIDMTGNYVALTMWINVDANWVVGDQFELYAFVGGVLVGNAVHLEDYFDITLLDVWQYINIPLTDLGIEASLIDAFRIENVARAGPNSPTFYIDDWYLQESGTPVVYTIKPDKGTWLHVTESKMIFVDAVATDTPDVIHLGYDQILGATLTEGMLYELYQPGISDEATVSARMIGIADILQLPGWKIDSALSDDTNTTLTLSQELPVPMILKAEEFDRLQVTIEDDFSVFLMFRFAVAGYEEIR